MYVTTNFCEDDSLDLDTLLIQIQGAVRSRWYQLGKALEIDKEILDKCTNYPPEESIVEILDQWIKNFPGRPTWRDVSNALRQIDLQQLANDIEMVYKTGNNIITTGIPVCACMLILIHVFNQCGCTQCM